MAGARVGRGDGDGNGRAARGRHQPGEDFARLGPGW